MVIAVIVLAAGLVGGCTAVVITAAPCAFDPPPGDYGLMPVTNDTSATVTLFFCDDDSCNRGQLYDHVRAGRRLELQYEMCGGDQIGVTDASGLLIGCLTFPTGEPPKTRRLQVSGGTPCSTLTGVHPTVTDP